MKKNESRGFLDQFYVMFSKKNLLIIGMTFVGVSYVVAFRHGLLKKTFGQRSSYQSMSTISKTTEISVVHDNAIL
jgi:hypothetical protein